MRLFLAAATILLICSCIVPNAQAQGIDSIKPSTRAPEVPVEAALTKVPRKWYDIIGIKGYAQIRYNRFLETNPLLKCDQCDRSIGENGGIFIRRARLVFSGQIHQRVFMYIQYDLAANAAVVANGAQQNPGVGTFYLQIRDLYFDLSLDSAREFRFRLGQSKVPFSFENNQSSQNRIPFDRSDALNSATANERDLAVYFFWAPKKIRKRYAELTSSAMKGSGDYGIVGLGVFDGQPGNKPSDNNYIYSFARVTYPFKLRNGQYFEPGVQAYTGIFTVVPDQRASITKGEGPDGTDFNYTDQRMSTTFVLYPQPFGIQAEYNFGRGPEFNAPDTSIQDKPLDGGYITLSYRINLGKKQFLFPYGRYQFYNGGKKQELDSRSFRVKEYEFGVEWQPFYNLEVTVAYAMSSRLNRDSAHPDNYQYGNFLRLQMQFAY